MKKKPLHQPLISPLPVGEGPGVRASDLPEVRAFGHIPFGALLRKCTLRYCYNPNL
jgi:hypothetical protein